MKNRLLFSIILVVFIDLLGFSLIQPWTILLSLLHMRWENITKTDKTPKYILHLEDAYKPDIE